MSRRARAVIPGVPHHVTQRGNRGQTTFFGPDDYRLYLDIAAEEFGRASVQVWAYCLMPNHVHLIAAPDDEKGLAEAFGATHRRYTRHVNGREGWTGFLWQGRFASCAMDEEHLCHCIRYVGLNPVRAGLVRQAVDWPWSSVRAHRDGSPDALLTSGPVTERLGSTVREFFDFDAEAETHWKLRTATQTGRPLGSRDWVAALEATSGRSLAPSPRGRPWK